MAGTQVHYELFVRRTRTDSWSLDMATEDRALALATAEQMMKAGRVAAVRVCKESMDEDTREFQSISILNLGIAEVAKTVKARETFEPLCIAPQDLYSVHARDRIGRLLEAWLERRGATAFELLHRPDLVEDLERSGNDLQHAIQKVAVPEAQARGLSVHELIRTFQSLVERSIQRILKDARKGAMPDVDKEGFAAAAQRVANHPERAYLLGVGVAVSIAPGRSWSEKIVRLLDLAEAAPPAGPARALALAVIEQPLAEILGSRMGLDEVIGRDLDLGGRLAAMTRLAASEPVEALMRAQPRVAAMMPSLAPAAQRLAKWLASEDFESARVAIAKRVVRDLTGPKRLRPSDAEGEIELLRALAMALTAAAGQGALIPMEDVQEAFVTRSRNLVTAEFVEDYLEKSATARHEAESLIWLVENVIGGANKRQAARYLSACVAGLRFETEIRSDPEGPATRLAALAGLQKACARGGLSPEDYAPIQAKIGDVGGMVEADSRLVFQLARANTSAVRRVMLLLQLAMGETGPLGPAADRAKAEALKLVRQDDIRQELAAAPEEMRQVRELMQRVTKSAA